MNAVQRIMSVWGVATCFGFAMAIILFSVMPMKLLAEEKTPMAASGDAGESIQARLARAMSAGPTDIGSGARIIDTDKQGNTLVLREGSNGFTCMPGDPTEIGKPPMCADAVAMQWSTGFKAHRPKPTNAVPGIIYMLAGATQRSDSDPFDMTSEAITVGPHWMIMWPFDPTTTGLPARHKATGAYVMWAGSPYAHLHVMGNP